MKIYAICRTYEAGYEGDKENIKRSGIKIGDKIELKDANVGRFHTTIKLVGYSNTFNSVFFDYVDENGNEYNIIKDKRFNPYIALR